MIVVKIELWPFGFESQKRHLGTIKIANDASGDHNTGNYTATLSKSNNPERIWKEGSVTGFPRLRLGAYDLLYRVLHDVVGSRNVPKKDKTKITVDTPVEESVEY